MSKFCGKCGSPLNENGKCPNCDVIIEQFKKKKTAVCGACRCVSWHCSCRCLVCQP